MSKSCWLIGEETLLSACGERLLAAGFTLQGVASPNPALRAWAADRGAAALDMAEDWRSALSAEPFDYLFSIANTRMLPEAVVESPRRLAINYHDGPLPRYAGLYATSWAILNQEMTHGVAWHVMKTEADAGDLLATRAIEIDPQETAYTLNVKCYEAALTAFDGLIADISADQLAPKPQDMSHRTVYTRAMRPVAASVIDWSRPAGGIDALVRACDFGPQPNPFASAKVLTPSDCFVVETLSPQPTRSGAAPGTILRLSEKEALIATATYDAAIRSLRALDGSPAPLSVLGGDVLPTPSVEQAAVMDRAARGSHRTEPAAARLLADPAALNLPWFVSAPQESRRLRRKFISIPANVQALCESETPHAVMFALFALFLARLSGQKHYDLAVCGGEAKGVALDWAPLRIEADPAAPLGEIAADLSAQITRQRAAPKPLADLFHRYRLTPTRPRVALWDDNAEHIDPAAPLSLAVDTSGREVALLHDAATFSSQAAEDLGERFARFLAEADFAAPLRAAPLLSEEETRRILIEWNAVAAPYPEKTLPALISEQARRSPEATAAVCGDAHMTYAELEARSDALAGALSARGADAGECVGVLLPRSLDLVVALIAVSKTGAAYVPLDPIYPPERLSHMISDSGAKLVVAAPEFAHLAAPAQAVAPGAVGDGLITGPNMDDLAYVIYTSGSTGTPKGVELTHRNLANLLHSIAREPGVGAQDRFLALTTVCFDIAALELFTPLIVGGILDLATEADLADPFALVQRIDETAPTVIQATPAAWRALVAAGWRGGARVLCGGEALPDDLAADLTARSADVWNMFGPTETTIWSTCDRVRSGAPVAIGRPLANTQLYILDAHGQPIPPELPGELHIGGDGVARGYRGRADLTAERFISAPAAEGRRVYKTGDLAAWTLDGRVRYLNRLDHQVKIRGYRIELGEIEAALRAVSDVLDAAVAAVDNPSGGKRLVGYVVGAAQGDLRAPLAQTLPDYMVPEAIIVLDRLPLTANGKIDRVALAARPIAPPEADLAPTTGGGAAKIAHCWRMVLGREAIGVRERFFEAGGDSVSLIQLIALLRKEIRSDIAAADVFRHPTIAAFADWLEADAPEGASKSSDRVAKRAQALRRPRRRGA